MEAEAVLNLFDSFWFYGFQISQTQTKTSIASADPEPNPVRNLTIDTSRSRIEHLTIITPKINVSTAISSPDSVLFKPHLESMLSEEEITLGRAPRTPQFKKPSGSVNLRKMKRTFSKSLSQLEFEELKGFMDLGFVFSEEDKLDSDLLEIIPGLQKLGRNSSDGEEKKEERIRNVGEFSGSGSGPRARPYLSEAWENMERKRKMGERPLMNWRVPAIAVGDEIGMKDSLKWWAHSVASAVK